jgi:hypothetical protein
MKLSIGRGDVGESKFEISPLVAVGWEAAIQVNLNPCHTNARYTVCM